MWSASLFAASSSILLHLSITPATALPHIARSALQTFNNNIVFQSPSNYTTPGTLYARSLLLPDSSLLATWENYSPEPPPVYFPIYRSTDTGATWSSLSTVTDQALQRGLRYQPFLYLLPRAFAKWPKDTVLLAGSSIPTDLSETQIELYASLDSGVTWEFVSHIAAGGRAVPDNGETPVWEPSLMLLDDQDVLVCYYSDQRDPAHGQKLVHQATTNGLVWADVVTDVAYDEYTARPGMPIVARMGTDGQYIMTYEYGGGDVNGAQPENYTFPVYYKISGDPLGFGGVEGTALVAGGVVPVSSPYVVYDDDKDMLVVSCGTLGDVFVNKAKGDKGSWESRATGEGVSYTRSLTLLGAGTGGLLIAGGGALPPSTGNAVTVGVIDISGW